MNYVCLHLHGSALWASAPQGWRYLMPRLAEMQTQFSLCSSHYRVQDHWFRLPARHRRQKLSLPQTIRSYLAVSCHQMFFNKEGGLERKRFTCWRNVFRCNDVFFPFPMDCAHFVWPCICPAVATIGKKAWSDEILQFKTFRKVPLCTGRKKPILRRQLFRHWKFVCRMAFQTYCCFG